MTTLSPGPPSRTSMPAAADQHVVAGAADEDVVAGAADQDVVAVAAVGGELDRAGAEARSLDHVVAGKGVDDDAVVGRLEAGDVDLRRQAEHRDAAVVADDQDHVVAVGGVDDDGVGRAVAEPAGAGEVEVHLRDIGARTGR